MPFHEIPFFRLLLCLIGGIGLTYFFPPVYFNNLYLVSLFFICLNVFIPGKLNGSSWLFHLTFVSIALTILFSRMEYLNPSNKKTYFGKQLTLVKFQGKVLSHKSRINGGWRYILEVSHVFNDKNQASKSSGLLLIYLSRSNSIPFSSGTIIQGEIKKLLPIPKAFNPGSFNQKKYWSDKRIFLKAYGNSEHWKEIRKVSGSLFYRDKVQYFISEVFRKVIKDSTSLGLINALLIGDKAGLSPEIMTDFKRTGAVHILAVSGIHVGILVGIIQFMLGLMPIHKRGFQIFSSCIFIIFLLFFAWLTHFEPAIMRAVGGTIIMILAKIFQKTANAWNNLFAMACFLLLWDPNYLFHIGFQLSFIAVAGILAFYKSWVKRIVFKHTMIAYFWEMTVMGFAAQWVTLPFLLFHFQQFSWLFLITGWIAIPLSTFILGFSLFYLLISFIPYLNGFVGWILELSINLFRWIMSYLSSFSWAVSEGIYLHVIALVLLIILVLSIAYAIEYRKRNVFILSLCLLFSLFHFSFVIRNNKKDQNYILSERQNAVLTLRKGNSFYVFSKEPVDKHRQDLLFLGQWASNIQYHILPREIISFSFQTKTLVLIDGDNIKDFIPFGSHWWVLKPVYADWEKWMVECPPELLILNGSLPLNFKKYLINIAKKLEIKVFDTFESGACFLKNE